MGQSQSVSEVSSCQSASSLDSSVSCSAKRSSKEDIIFPKVLINCREGEVKVERLGIYMEPIASEQPLAFTHHFLIINVDWVKKSDGSRAKPGFIKAEKGKSGKFGEIKVKCSPEFQPNDYEAKRVCTLVEDCGTIPMQKVLDILEKPTDYCFLTENCWKYAEQTFRELVEEFSDRAEPESEMKEKLQRYLIALPSLQMPGDAGVWSVGEVCRCAVPPFVVSCMIIGGVCLLAALTVWTAGTAAVALLPVLGMGSPTPLAGPVVLQTALKFAAAEAVLSSFPRAVVANHIFSAAAPSTGTNLADRVVAGAIKLRGRIHNAAPLKAGLKDVFLAAVKAACSTPVLLVALGGVGVAGLLFLVLFGRKLYRGMKTGFKDNMTFSEFVVLHFRRWRQCLLRFVSNGSVNC